MGNRKAAQTVVCNNSRCNRVADPLVTLDYCSFFSFYPTSAKLRRNPGCPFLSLCGEVESLSTILNACWVNTLDQPSAITETSNQFPFSALLTRFRTHWPQRLAPISPGQHQLVSNIPFTPSWGHGIMSFNIQTLSASKFGWGLEGALIPSLWGHG